GRGAAGGVAVALALDPLFIRYSLAISPDMPLTLCSVMGLIAAHDVAARGRLRDSLAGGLWLGLGVACKYSPILLAVPMVLAHAQRPHGRRGWVILDGRLWLAAAVSAAAFALASPFPLVDLSGRWSQFRLGADVLVHAPTGAIHRFAAAEFLSRTLPNDLGWPLYVLIAVAAGVTLVRGSLGARLALAFALANLVVFGLVPTPFERYL